MANHYTPASFSLPAHLVDVIGLVDDEDGLTRMLVYLHPDGRWLASQSERDIELPVIAWADLPRIPEGCTGCHYREVDAEQLAARGLPTCLLRLDDCRMAKHREVDS